MNESAVVLFSGGQDSTTCLYWAIKRFRKVYAVSFLYGQKHAKEVELARKIAEEAGVEFHVIETNFIGNLGNNSLTDSSVLMDEAVPEGGLPNTFVPGRNLFRPGKCQPGKGIHQYFDADRQGGGNRHIYRRSCNKRRRGGRSQSLRAYG